MRSLEITYDSEADALAIYLSDEYVHETRNIAPGVEVDYDRDGRVLGFEVLGASKKYDMDWDAFDAPSPYFSLAEGAEILGLSPSTLRHQVHRGVLKAVKVGRNWVVHGDDVFAYYREHSRKAKQAAKLTTEDLIASGRIKLPAPESLPAIAEDAADYSA